MVSSASQMVIIFFLCATSVILGMSPGKNMIVSCSRKDQDLLSTFKESVTDPSNLLSSWTIEEDCCKWKGVQCNNVTGRVTELNLPCLLKDFYDFENGFSKCLGGEINFSLFQLEFLRFLDLSWNYFETIHYGSHKYPLEASSFPTNFSSLQFLDLSSNHNLHMDNLRWLPHFSSLNYLNLDGINLSNETLWLHWMAMLPSLMELRLSGCDLNGINPSLGYVNFTSLTILDISSNFFDSEMPKWLFNLSSRISYLDLSFNDLRGQIPETMLVFKHLRSFSYLDLSFNDLRGQIPETMLVFKHLRSFSLRGNKLNGSIPEWIGKFNHLEKLDLSDNLLSGCIPETIGNLSSLKYLDVSHNRLNSSLPISFGKLAKLESLFIGYNSLSSNLSEQSFTKLSSLKSLRLDSSAFIFNFGTHWKPPFQLELISMRNCKLGTEFPSWLYTQRSLFYVDISSSGLSFNVQDEFQSFVTQIEYLILSNNSISGDISTLLFTGTTIDLSFNNFTGGLPRLSPHVSFFNMANNRFSGPIFPLLCQNVTGKPKLALLDLSHNLLSGEFPSCWMHWQSLVRVNLGGNNLSGKIPYSMGSLVKLETLRLRNNSLSGNIPSSLQNCNLWLLDLAFNEFTGKIPSWIRSLNMVLMLRSNKFSGSIPSHICQLSNLLVLDLAKNKLSGPIPTCLNNITTLVTDTIDEELFIDHYYLWDLAPFLVDSYLQDLPLFVKGLNLDYWHSFKLVRIVDLSSNDLSGLIPPELFSLIALQSLNLSHNHLMGKIPSNIGQMKFLESLDLSRNRLSGEIPQSMSNLSFLNHLNLSYNNFNGRILLSTQLQSFEASSYIGNPRLCGPPLPKNCSQQEKPKDLIKSVKVSKDGDFKSSFKIGVGVGFASTFWGTFGTILFIRKYRHAYFRFLDNLYVIIIVKINQLRRFQL